MLSPTGTCHSESLSSSTSTSASNSNLPSVLLQSCNVDIAKVPGEKPVQPQKVDYPYRSFEVRNVPLISIGVICIHGLSIQLKQMQRILLSLQDVSIL